MSTASAVCEMTGLSGALQIGAAMLTVCAGSHAFPVVTSTPCLSAHDTNQKEDHQKGVGSDEHIVDATHKGKSQLTAHSHRKECTIDAGLKSNKKIEAAHLFWIG